MSALHASRLPARIALTKLPNGPPRGDLSLGVVDLLLLVAAVPVELVVDQTVVLEIEVVLDFGLVAFVRHVADGEEQVLIVAKVHHGELRVGRLALVVPGEPAADAHDALRVRLPQRPASHVHLVHPLVTDLAVAGDPEPVPVVVDEVPVEPVVRDHGRAAPEVPVVV